MIKVSIITINYNNAEGLKKTIESVINQSSKIEYLVIDGGSSDKSVEIIERFKDKIDYWVSEKDNGIYNAMNKGIRSATGNYLLFLNSGDVLIDKFVIEKMIDKEDGSIDLIYGNLARTFPDGRKDEVCMPNFIDVPIMMNGTLCHPITLIHKRLFIDYGLYDERLKIVADWAFFLKVIVLGNATQKHKNVLVANFTMDGISSLAANQKLVNEEREWVKSTYLSAALYKLYSDYHLYENWYNNKWNYRFRKVYNLFKSVSIR
jgi:glycosyltransferase involved in cell wall biosynthesis